jgi:aspartate kinase
MCKNIPILALSEVIVAGKIVRIIQKFGGTSVANIARLEKVALRVKREVDAGNQVAVVVSAMAGVTNQLVSYTKALSSHMPTPEHDTVHATGEQITSGLLALALNQIGIPARSFLGWQIPIITDEQFSNARIQHINPQALENCWAQGITPVISGFQGITKDHRITTLGRGGSDTTAVALAAAVKADRCDIYTDVEGVFTADPRIVPKARKLSEISYLEMVELAAHGAKVLHTRSVETAMDHHIPLQVLSSFHDNPGTVVRPFPALNSQLRGITHNYDWTLINLRHLQYPLKAIRQLNQAFQSQAVTSDMFVLTDTDPQHLSFTITKGDLAKVIEAIEQTIPDFKPSHLDVQSNIAKITLVGLGMTEPQGHNNRIFEFLNQRNLANALTASTSVKTSIVVPEDLAEHIIRDLHQSLGLDKEQEF